MQIPDTQPEIFFQYPNPTRPEVEKPYPSDPDYIILIVPHQAIAALSPSGIETRVAHIDDNLVIISQIDNIFFWQSHRSLLSFKLKHISSFQLSNCAFSGWDRNWAETDPKTKGETEWGKEQSSVQNFFFFFFFALFSLGQNWATSQTKTKGEIRECGHNFFLLLQKILLVWYCSLCSGHNPTCHHKRIREAFMCQLCSFFKHCSNGGGDQTHVEKFCCKYSIILKGFLAT